MMYSEIIDDASIMESLVSVVILMTTHFMKVYICTYTNVIYYKDKFTETCNRLIAIYIKLEL